MTCHDITLAVMLSAGTPGDLQVAGISDFLGTWIQIT